MKGSRTLQRGCSDYQREEKLATKAGAIQFGLCC
jgi:hypothetical protein